ncbi:hypothetical protein M5689_010540 [Euphorbia peplus]|nr:hypothetical protein M5689_010540 [Euphorbia peplus]
MASLPIFLSLLSLLSLSTPTLSLSNNSSISVYEILPKYGLPSGLLPSSVANYSLSDDGRFVVVLEKPCYIQFDYLVYYDTQITGKLNYGVISDLDGIEVKKFFMWLGVDEIKVDLPPSDSIYFKVGIINRKLDKDQFETVHTCRDGVSRGLFHRILELPTSAEDVEMLITE